MIEAKSWWVGVLSLGVLGATGAVACSSSDSSPATSTGSGGCSGIQCGAGGVGGAAGSGGAAGNGGIAVEPSGSGGQESQCTTLRLATGATSPDGVLALHAPPADSFSDPYGYNFAVADGYVYFDLDSKITRVPVKGGPLEPVVALKDDHERFFVIDGQVIWIEQDPTTKAYGISRTAVTPSDSGAPFVVAAAIEEPEYSVADSKAVYFSSRSKAVWYKAPLDGSGVKELATNAQALGAVVSNDVLYWIDFNADRVMSVPTAGGTATGLVGVFFGGPMLADGTTLYWNDTSQETLNRWAPPAKTATVIASFANFEGAESIALQSGDLYYTTEGFGCGGVHRLKADGSPATLVRNGFDSATAVATDADSVYVLASNGVFRMAR